ncbi:MAG: hypothetical protein AAF799_21990 [Myxococcota bacterium]
MNEPKNPTRDNERDDRELDIVDIDIEDLEKVIGGRSANCIVVACNISAVEPSPN